MKTFLFLTIELSHNLDRVQNYAKRSTMALVLLQDELSLLLCSLHSVNEDFVKRMYDDAYYTFTETCLMRKEDYR